MKKIVFTILFSLASLSAIAQGIDPRFFNNQFLAVGGGPSFYANEEAMTTGYNAELSLGNWILRDMALRFSFGTASAENARNLTSSFYYGHCSFMWDAISTLSGTNDAYRIFSIYPMLGLGVIYRPDIPIPEGVTDLENEILNADSTAYSYVFDFMAMVGAHFEFRIPTPVMRKFPLFLEAKMFILPQEYDFNHKISSLYNVSFGIKADLKYDPHHRSISGESQGWNYDWFVGLGAGPNYSMLKVTSPDIYFSDRMGWNADITFGRNLSSLWTVRFGFSIMSGTTEAVVREGFDAQPYDYTFYNFRSDLMFNVVNISGMRRGRRIGVLPYAGAGMIKRFDKDLLVMEADAGVEARWYITKNLDIYVDGRYVMVPPRFNDGNDQMSNGYPLFNAGIIYNFDPSSSRYAKASFSLKN